MANRLKSQDAAARRPPINFFGLIGFGLAAVFAVIEGWSLPQFCWGTWLAGLIYVWANVATASLKIIFSASSTRLTITDRIPPLRRIPPNVFVLGIGVIGVAVGYLAFRIYGFVFGFYGLFLSVFAEMEPAALFGKNGFINSDFYTPVIYLVERLWPIPVGVLIANWGDFVRGNPWKRILLPVENEILRMHIMVLVLPALSVVAWATFRESYQSVSIVLLMAVLYLLPKRPPEGDPGGRRTQAGPSMTLRER
jgi:hypothetical protein